MTLGFGALIANTAGVIGAALAAAAPIILAVIIVVAIVAVVVTAIKAKERREKDRARSSGSTISSSSPGNNDDNDDGRNDPRNRERANRDAREAAIKYKLTEAGKRLLHDRITGQGFSRARVFREAAEIAATGSPKYVNLTIVPPVILPQKPTPSTPQTNANSSNSSENKSQNKPPTTVQNNSSSNVSAPRGMWYVVAFGGSWISSGYSSQKQAQNFMMSSGWYRYPSAAVRFMHR